MDGPHWDLRFGSLCALVANKLRPKDADVLYPWDFFPTIERPPRRQMSAEEMLTNAVAWTLAMGGKVIESGQKT